MSELLCLSPLRLLGPLSDRELRVASRRVRSYALRSGYIVLLCLLILSAWYSIVGLPAGSVRTFGTSRASVVSTYVAVRILLFQFAAAQLLAALMLSFSVGDEMRRGTLSVLLTTPITSVHIVAGKLLGGLWQTVLLLAISLPALAVLRLLGGLSWEEVCAGFCITLTAAVFAGTLSLLLSTYYPYPYQAVSAVAATYLVLFAGLPFAVDSLAYLAVTSPPWTKSVLDLLSPFRAVYWTLPWLGRPRAAGAGSFAWPLHCLIMMGLALAASGASVRRIRRAAMGPSGLGRKSGASRRRGMSVTWADDPAGYLLQNRTLWIVLAAAAACFFIVTRGTARGRSVSVFPYYYGLGGLWLLVLLRLAISTAGGIAREKESGAWPVLLMTPLSEMQILWRKVVTALRRNAVLLLAMLAIQTCLMLRSGAPGGVWITVFYGLWRLAAIGFIVGAGLYFGTRLRTTTAAVAATMGMFLCVTYLVAGPYNPIFPLFWRTIGSSLIRRGGSSAAFYAGLTIGPMFVVTAALGLDLLRRARRNVRLYVF